MNIYDEQDQPRIVSDVHLPVFIHPQLTGMGMEKQPNALGRFDAGLVGTGQLRELSDHDMSACPNLKMKKLGVSSHVDLARGSIPGQPFYRFAVPSISSVITAGARSGFCCSVRPSVSHSRQTQPGLLNLK
jgi:hypothetical protein